MSRVFLKQKNGVSNSKVFELSYPFSVDQEATWRADATQCSQKHSRTFQKSSEELEQVFWVKKEIEWNSEKDVIFCVEFMKKFGAHDSRTMNLM